MTTETTTKVVTRFAPSPTGFLHLGNYRTALFSYLYARQHKGTFFLRIEDTDKERSKPEYAADIIENLAWMKLDYDNADNVMYDSQRGAAHKKYLQQLIDEGKAYISKEEPKEPGARAEVIRFKNPNKKVTFTDLIRGDITFDTTELGDFIIAKSMEEPVFHFSVVVDDIDMGITHIVRGEDHISNTPRQILVQEAFGAPRPIYAHLPLVLAPDRTKYSKRKGAKSIKQYREEGYLAEAIVNGLALIGWNPGDNRDKELLSIETLIRDFRLEKVQKGGAIFNEEKLLSLNREYIKRMPKDQIMPLIRAKMPQIDAKMLDRASDAIIDRLSTLNDIDALAQNGEFDYLYPNFESTAAATYPVEKLYWKGEATPAATKEYLTAVRTLLAELDELPTPEVVKAKIFDYATEKGRGQVLWPLRVALTGKDKSPDPFIVFSIIGKTESLKRIDAAIVKVS